MDTATCQCGAVRLKLPPLPAGQTQPTLYNCHCSLCRKQSGSAFSASAKFPDFALPVDTQPLGVYTRKTFDPAVVKDCYFCRECGVRVVHRTRATGEPREEAGAAARGGPTYVVKEGSFVTVKAGCIEGIDWNGAVHIFCGDAVVNLEFPEGVKTFVEDTDSPVWGKRKVDR